MQIFMQSIFASGSLVDEIFHLIFSPGVTLVDSPGFNSSIADMEELVWLLADLQQVLLHRIGEANATCLNVFLSHTHFVSLKGGPLCGYLQVWGQIQSRIGQVGGSYLRFLKLN